MGIHPEVMLPLVELCSVFLDSCCLLGSHLKGKGKGILGAREGQGAREEGGRKEERRRGGKHLEGVATLLLEVASFKWVSCGHVTSSG